jgi:hypothetical protein
LQLSRSDEQPRSGSSQPIAEQVTPEQVALVRQVTSQPHEDPQLTSRHDPVPLQSTRHGPRPQLIARQLPSPLHVTLHGELPAQVTPLRHALAIVHWTSQLQPDGQAIR